MLPQCRSISGLSRRVLNPLLPRLPQTSLHNLIVCMHSNTSLLGHDPGHATVPVHFANLHDFILRIKQIDIIPLPSLDCFSSAHSRVTSRYGSGGDLLFFLLRYSSSDLSLDTSSGRSSEYLYDGPVAVGSLVLLLRKTPLIAIVIHCTIVSTELRLRSGSGAGAVSAMISKCGCFVVVAGVVRAGPVSGTWLLAMYAESRGR